MKVKIINDLSSSQNGYCSNIEHLIGKIFEAKFENESKEDVVINDLDLHIYDLVIFNGEYEIIDD